MNFKHIVVTGGSGFVGANLLRLFREQFPNLKLTAFDNLKRRGSELHLPHFKRLGIEFVHGDVRCVEDVEALPGFDLLIDCAAEPSVQAGVKGDTLSLLHHNLLGTIHCLEAARLRRAAVLFLSTSRVYPIAALNALRYAELATRFAWTDPQTTPGCSSAGIREDFPLSGPRSLYGSSKLAGELLLQEYVATFGLPGLINRCGVLAGPWQMARTDQGVVTLWVAAHHFKRKLAYHGFGGEGKQVRDVLHIHDFFDLVVRQLQNIELWDGRVYNVGGGAARAVSLMELTELCRTTTGRKIPVGKQPGTSKVDVRIFVTDSSLAAADFEWSARRSVDTTVRDIHEWIVECQTDLAGLLE
jgi:CDP-paratose 2-epimerase